MRNDNLTAEEARDRSALLRVGSYDVHVDLTHAADPERLAYPVRAAVRFEVLAADPAAQTTFIEYLHHSVEAITLNGRRLDPRTAVVGSRITLTGLERSNELVVHGFSLYSRSGEGLHRFLDPEDGRTYLYTQYEPADCRRVFPTFEQPDLKASFRFAVTAPRDWVVASNTPVEREEQDPVDESVSKRIFAPTQRISTYITTLLAGQYHAVSSMYQPSADTAVDGVEPKPMTLYCRQALAAHLPARELFELVGAGLDFFQVLFDLAYPFPQYDQAFVPEYNLGAMENPGLVTFTENYLHPGGATEAQREARANVIMHEMSHMWFGDLVTMSWWSDLWLKESFAEFMGAWVPSAPAASIRPGSASPTGARPGPTAKTPTPRPTRSSRTSPMWRRPNRTSTASPTRRAPRCSSSWWPTWASSGSSAPPGSTSAATPGAPRAWRISWRPWRSPAGGTSGPGRGSGCRPPGSRCCARTAPASSRSCPRGSPPSSAGPTRCTRASSTRSTAPCACARTGPWRCPRAARVWTWSFRTPSTRRSRRDCCCLTGRT
ncbi:hypothetical protein A5N15_10725 [Rothia kristinae]|uniref:Aminopeptidase N n=1 Tax=Rothia kristinae TaxID=37923 RepID=A0A657ITP5_9MICC|nr:hypothetical protein A5N15_10725 [Rothia kristinae]